MWSISNLTCRKFSSKFEKQLLNRLRKAERIVFFTGAGASQESGVPTFREGTSSLWGDFDPQTYATLNGFDNNPAKVWNWYSERRQAVRALKPNSTHQVIAAWEQKATHVTVVTQNIDGFHQRAGSQAVIELHGSLAMDKCRKHSHRFPHDFDQLIDQPPQCPICKSLLRPDVVWFAEELPENAYESAEIKVLESDVFVSVGCSMEIYPAASLAYKAAHCGAYVVQINTQETSLDKVADCNLHGKAGEVLPAIWQAVWGDNLF